MKNSKWLLPLLAAVIGVLLAWSVSQFVGSPNVAALSLPTGNGLPEGGDFVLDGANGVVKSADYRGKTLVLYLVIPLAQMSVRLRWRR